MSLTRVGTSLHAAERCSLYLRQLGIGLFAVSTTTDRRSAVSTMKKILHLILAILGWLLATHRLLIAIDAF